MASPQESVSMALFCDFENVALGVRDAKYEKFDMKPVLERLLLKGSIVVKKAYCDWDRYKGFKSAMHEASFELIEIPHVRQSGKNSADIRLVVDALDLCYTKSHVDTFVIISGDSDFSPLVSKLRENAKKVIGVGVKNSTSDLLVANCDEFIFYDDLVREQQRALAKREVREASTAKRSADEDKQPRHELEARKAKAFAIAVETFDALVSERGESGKIWASVLKSAIKRRKPDFSESYYGFRAFGNLLEEAQSRGLLEVGRDEKSGAFVYRSPQATPGETPAPVSSPDVFEDVGSAVSTAKSGGEKGRRRGRSGGRQSSPQVAQPAQGEALAQDAPTTEPTSSYDEPAAEPAETAAAAHNAAVTEAVDVHEVRAERPASARRGRQSLRKKPAAGPTPASPSSSALETGAPVHEGEQRPESPQRRARPAIQPSLEALEPQSPPAEPAAETEPVKAATKPGARGRRPRKSVVAADMD